MWLVRQETIELHLNGETHTLHAGDTGIAVAGTLHYVKMPVEMLRPTLLLRWKMGRSLDN